MPSDVPQAIRIRISLSGMPSRFVFGHALDMPPRSYSGMPLDMPPRFVFGHAFRHAATIVSTCGFSRCDRSTGTRRLKPDSPRALSASLKRCPDTSRPSQSGVLSFEGGLLWHQSGGKIPNTTKQLIQDSRGRTGRALGWRSVAASFLLHLSRGRCKAL